MLDLGNQSPAVPVRPTAVAQPSARVATETRRNVIRAPAAGLQTDLQAVQFTVGTQPSAVLVGKATARDSFSFFGENGSRYAAVSEYRLATHGHAARATWFLLTPRASTEGEMELDAAPLDELFTVRRDVERTVRFVAPSELELDAAAERARKADRFRYDADDETDKELFTATSTAAAEDGNDDKADARKPTKKAGDTEKRKFELPSVPKLVSPAGSQPPPASPSPLMSQWTSAPTSQQPSAMPSPNPPQRVLSDPVPLKKHRPENPFGASPPPPAAAAAVVNGHSGSSATDSGPSQVAARCSEFVASRRNSTVPLAEVLKTIIHALNDFSVPRDADAQMAWFVTKKREALAALQAQGCTVVGKAVTIP
jgi:hypothetical protein